MTSAAHGAEHSHASAPSASSKGPPPAPVYESLEDVDWKNRAYLPGLLTLKDGYNEYHEYAEIGGLHDTTMWRLVSHAYGDWNADGSKEAVVLINEEYSPPNGAGSSRIRVFVYQLVDGQVTELGHSFEVNDAKSAAIYQGLVTLSAGGRCTVYRLEGEAWSKLEQACPKH